MDRVNQQGPPQLRIFPCYANLSQITINTTARDRRCRQTRTATITSRAYTSGSPRILPLSRCLPICSGGSPEQPPKIDVNDLEEDPELQQSLAYMVQYTPSKWLLEQEAGVLADRRELHGQRFPASGRATPTKTSTTGRGSIASPGCASPVAVSQRHLQPWDFAGTRGQGAGSIRSTTCERLRRRLHSLLAGSRLKRK